MAGSALYGTAAGYSTATSGTVFAISTNGTGFTTIHAFNGNDGGVPKGSLILSGNVLYGTTEDGGPASQGTIFAVTTNGSAFTNLYTFPYGTEGSNPEAGLALLGNTLYGTTRIYSNVVNGTIFSVNVDGTGLNYIHDFGVTKGDGIIPLSSMFLSGNVLYGTAYDDGPYGSAGGVVYSLTIPVPPTLSINSLETNVVLTWTNSGALYYLQSSTNLSGGVWTTVSNAPAATNGLTAWTNSTSAPTLFFRLSP